jgi:SAM-dependent methyltransferase
MGAVAGGRTPPAAGAGRGLRHTGIYLVHAATAGGPQLTGLGVNLDATVIGLARQRLADASLAERFDVRHGDIRTLELAAASFDLVLLFQNIYYFAENQRPDLLRRLHGLLAPGGTLLQASLLLGSLELV